VKFRTLPSESRNYSDYDESNKDVLPLLYSSFYYFYDYVIKILLNYKYEFNVTYYKYKFQLPIGKKFKHL